MKGERLSITPLKIRHKIKTQNEITKKLPLDCTEHPRKIALTRIQSKKDPGRKYPVKQTERPKTKIKLSLTQNRFVGLKVMDIADQKSQTSKLTKQKPFKDKTNLN